MKDFSPLYHPLFNNDDRNHNFSNISVRPQQIANIVEADDDDLIDLSEMDITIDKK
eukprot:CAMPEP_0176485266 /NCGR_PEP_ID=MMETSP0200_2-20121128/4949_1 /TAXON_ID=947934 /ORGANISM="Chaetoceros sp., Strain GSL56" /LENGTH=55 /DNA_ID=CAMNT_0017881901 /DNA_START=21 /DNA_END=188 /DNA_ORIENTATION=+